MFYMHLSIYRLALPFQVVVLPEETRQHKPSACIDFAVIDLMVPCDNWQLSLITRQGLKISLRKWPALWDVVQWLNKDKSIHLRKLLRKQDKEVSHRTTCCTASNSTYTTPCYTSKLQQTHYWFWKKSRKRPFVINCKWERSTTTCVRD